MLPISEKTSLQFFPWRRQALSHLHKQWQEASQSMAIGMFHSGHRRGDLFTIKLFEMTG
ncbi:hypothetical protein IQ273_26650 [Nodosilinea sp. LEGE 07298]|uniref:hypothetical protein n=1 Tax=Nodosilinea sp. LEGE 07298 TaxID=2777970 RepID=UPI00187F8855|nr:hypothetical protein [Nodosilinea sp. LEGE 07298]MBE9112972.1 hypothetical protein [Nodosilinea sp. LEGE 07298]